MLDQLSPSMLPQLYTLGINALGALAILILGWLAAGLLRRISSRGLRRTGIDEDLIPFLSKLVYYLIFAFAVVAAVDRFGIETTGFVAILGAVGFAIGFALQGSLSNFASGVMLLVFKPFRLGDFVEVAGVSGTVKEIEIFTTTLATPDNVKVLVPNSKIYGDTIRNYSAYDTRRLDLIIGIGYDSPIDKARDILENLVSADERILSEPEPLIVISELADSSVNFTVRIWVNRPDYWSVKFDLTEQVKTEFDAQDIEIPYPQRVIHQARTG